MRYGLQPVNGDHLGVSTYRDYSLLLPAAKDQKLDLPPRKQLEQRSAESAGTSHPAVLLLQGASAEVVQDDSLDGPRRRKEYVERRHSLENCWSRARRSRPFNPFFSSSWERPRYDRGMIRFTSARARVDGTRV